MQVETRLAMGFAAHFAAGVGGFGSVSAPSSCFCTPFVPDFSRVDGEELLPGQRLADILVDWARSCFSSFSSPPAREAEPGFAFKCDVVRFCSYVDLDTPLLLASDPVRGGYSGKSSEPSLLVVSAFGKT
jgi:hypothetical protein